MRQLPPKVILNAFRRWLERQAPRSAHWRAFDAMWRTSYLKDNLGIDVGRFDNAATGGHHWAEPNSIVTFVNAYVAGLNDPNLEAVVRRGADMKGDPKKAQLFLNAWIKHVDTDFDSFLQQVDRLAVMYDGAGATVELDPDQEEILDCVALNVVPCWEVFPDADVTNRRKQRFIGWHYFVPTLEAREKFRDPTLVGIPRPGDAYVTGTVGNAPRASELSPGEDDVVHVLEVYNLVDRYYVGESNAATGIPVEGFEPAEDTPSSVGRREFYVLGDAAEKGPRLVMALPFRTPTRKVVMPLPYLTYLHMPGYPNIGLSMVDGVFDAFREKMDLRTRQVRNVNAQVPHFGYPEGMFGDDALNLYEQGVTGGMKYDPKKAPDEGHPASAVFPLPMQNIVYDNVMLGQDIQKDIERSTLQSPAQRGQVSGGSATEVLQAAETGQDERSLMWTDKKRFIVQVLHAALAAGRMALRSKGPDATLNVVEGSGDEEIVHEISFDDLDGSFVIEVDSGEPTKLAEARAVDSLIALMRVLLPLQQALVKGDRNAAMMNDDLVRKARLGKKYLSENLLELAADTVATDVEIPRGPGAESALPGQGSTPGGPQPETEQPMDNQTGVAQNATGAS